jgi:hypothetical protein
MFMCCKFFASRLFDSRSFRLIIVFSVFVFLFGLTAVQSSAAANLVVTNTLDSGTGSLRAAVNIANNNVQPDTITFNIPSGQAGCAGSACTILLASQITLQPDSGNLLTISGSGTNTIALSGNNAVRILKVDSGANVSVNDLTITNGNSGIDTGGGITISGSLTLIRTTVSNNTSNSGAGGINVTAGVLTLINSTVSGNTAPFDGGISSFGALTLISVTVTNNIMTGGNTNPIFTGGVNNRSGTATVRNSIIAGNRSGSISQDVKGNFISQGYNLIGNTESSSGFSAANNDILNPAGGARLGSLARNGGATQTHALLADSPAIDKGKNFDLTTDQRGLPRPFDFPAIANASGGDGSDIGAFERQNSEDGIIRGTELDFDGDRRADYALFRPNNSWLIFRSSTSNLITVAPFGLASDIMTPGDYDGDRRTDISVYRPSAGTFFVLRSADNTFQAVQFGVDGDEPVARDYSGDGRTDFAVVRRENGLLTWFILNSNNFAFSAAQFGLATDKVAPGDYDGDGRFDLAVFRGSGANRSGQATFFVQRSTDGFQAVQFGLGGDAVVPGDYDGDNRYDFAVVRQGTPFMWYILSSSSFGFRAIQFGTQPFLPTQADYDGDGRTDISVWNPQTAVFFTLRSSDSVTVSGPFGQNGDYPVANYDTH